MVDAVNVPSGAVALSAVTVTANQPHAASVKLSVFVSRFCAQKTTDANLRLAA